MKKIILTLVVIAWVQSFCQAQSITEVFFPKYMQGVGMVSTTLEKRVPYACRLTLNGLLPSTTYRYFNRFIVDPNNTTSSGDGGVIFVLQSGSFIRTTSPNFSQANRYAELTTDPFGSYTGWFVAEPSTATVFGPGNDLHMRIALNDGNGGIAIAQFLTTSKTIKVINFGAGVSEGTACYTSPAIGATAKNFVMLYDNTVGSSDPIIGTFIEADGTVNNSSTFYAPFYGTDVNDKDKVWGNIIPNNLTNGIRKIVQYSLADGTEVGSNMSADGSWPSVGGGTASTVNTTGGLTTPIVLDGSLVSLSSSRTPQTVTFTSTFPSEILIGDPDFTVSATASSGLTDIQYSTSPAGILQIVGNTVTAIGPGTATITATQVGDATYDLASATSAPIVVKRKQAITFSDIPSRIYGDEVFALEVSSDNLNIPLTLTSSDPAIARVFYESLEDRWKIQIHGAGMVNITASQAGNTEYKETSVVKSFSVAQKLLTITADNKTREFNTANPVLTATYTGFIAGENEANLTTQALLETTADQTSPIGEYPITVSGATSLNYSITFVNGTLLVINKLQTVTFPAIANKVYGDAAFNPGATSNSGATPIYSSNNTAVAVVDNDEIRIKGAGEVRITATFPAINEYGATSADRTFTVLKKSLTITADNKTRTYGTDNPQLTVTYDGFVNGETSDALPTKPVLQTSAVKDSEVNTYAITVSGATSVNYDITQVSGTFTITKTPLTITAQDKTKVLGAPNPPLTLTYSGFVNSETQNVLLTLPVLFTSAVQDSPIGEYPITVSGTSASNYEITHVNATLVISQGSRTLTFNTLAARTFGAADFNPGAILSSGEQPLYTSSNPLVATIENGLVHILTAGATTITAIAPANSVYDNTPSRSQNLVINRAPQLISFEVIPDLTLGNPHEISVSATSGLDVELTIENTAIARLEDNRIVPLREGITKITAVQRGNTNHQAAEPYIQEIRIADPDGDFIAITPAVSINGDGVNDFLSITGIEDYAENHLTIVNRNGTMVFEIDNYDNQFKVFEGKGNANYMGRLPEGTYFYVLEFRTTTDRKKKTGFFVLKY